MKLSEGLEWHPHVFVSRFSSEHLNEVGAPPICHTEIKENLETMTFDYFVHLDGTLIKGSEMSFEAADYEVRKALDYLMERYNGN